MHPKSTLHLLVLLLWLVSSTSSQGLFPPLFSSDNFAESETVVSTSTCGTCEEEECATCNSTCPFGDSLPVPLDLMAIGTLQAGIVSKLYRRVDLVCNETIHSLEFSSVFPIFLCLLRQFWTVKVRVDSLSTALMASPTPLLALVMSYLSNRPMGSHLPAGWLKSLEMMGNHSSVLIVAY